ncbi:TetR/AcrR family transcriptional regulator [Streptomyces sp. NPDC051940]|uniref:TetR/AcrR family transcriptional regulator n=1 Tax=Streptomyces sp. NPDC051940 TaxID=3155675 RepID=UPI00342BA4D3
MPRPSRYTTGQLLDAALALADTGGPTAVTMTAVAKEAGVPSGSLYHRFPGRADLLAALWLRTLERFHAGYLDVLAGDGTPERIALDASRHLVGWCREHPSEARVLRHGADAFGQDEWPAAAREQLKAANERVMGAIHALAARLGATGAKGRARVVAAIVEVPYGLVQTHLRERETVPAAKADMAEECARALLAPVVHAPR